LWEKKENFLQKLQLPVRIPGGTGIFTERKNILSNPVQGEFREIALMNKKYLRIA
jgi:hypothetical protein